MNPLVGAISGIASLLGIGSSLVAQGVNLHRQMNPPQQQAQLQAQQQQQHCPPGFRLEVIITASGQRQDCTHPRRDEAFTNPPNAQARFAEARLSRTNQQLSRHNRQ